jgi:uncharacterized membrane protein
MRVELLLGMGVALFATSAFAAPPSHCAGTEPFWALRYKGKKGKFSMPHTPKGRAFSLLGTKRYSGFTDKMGFKASLRFNNTRKRASLYIFRSRCSDNMSTYSYRFAAVLDLGKDGLLYGCCGKPGGYKVGGVPSGAFVGVHIRPGNKHKVVYKLPVSGPSFSVVRCKKGWCEIRGALNVKGWVDQRFIKRFKP